MKRFNWIFILIAIAQSSNFGLNNFIEPLKTIKPILLDKEALSGIGLSKIDLKNEPEKDFFQRNLYRGDDLSVYIVSTESWNNSMNNFAFDEYVYMLHGQAKVTQHGEKEQIFNSYDHFFAPKGFTGNWEILAGKNYHYELSVITTKRAGTSDLDVPNKHQLIDKNKLSGSHINLDADGLYNEELVKGVELTISLKGETPRKVSIDQGAKEKLLHILSGQLNIKDSSGETHSFYTGDFLIIPEGFTGEWISLGHGIFKCLTVEKSTPD